VTRDGGASWTNVTRNIPGLLDWGTISNIEPSAVRRGNGVPDRGRAPGEQPRPVGLQDDGLRQDVAVDHERDPKTPLSYAHVVREDPVRRGSPVPRAPRTDCTSRSMTGRAGSRCRTTCRMPPCTGWSCSRTSRISWSRTYGVASGFSTTSHRSER
jgi:hypothetical protein